MSQSGPTRSALHTFNRISNISAAACGHDKKMHPLLDRYYRRFINLAEVSGPERPLRLAHYTSLEVLEKIIITEEVWLSNPLFTNDYEEVRFILNQSLQIIQNLHKNEYYTKSLGGAENCFKIAYFYEKYLKYFEDNHLFDIYIFCLSEYDEHDHPDGRLSMWRGYGANGHGAALVFDTSFVTVVPGSPFLITKVNYATSMEGVSWIEEVLKDCAQILAENAPDDEKIREAAWNVFNIMLIFSLCYKHPGFKEEQEWRIIYFPDRDIHQTLTENKTYIRHSNAIEPKLRFPIRPLSIDPDATWSFDSILHRIVLGPSHANALARKSAQRMLELLGKPKFADRIWVSEIPCRAVNR